MKKKLEAELISIAHRILKIHNRQDVIQLQKEALNLYEKLSILRFYQDNFEPTKPTIGKAELEEALNEKQDFSLVLDQEVQSQKLDETFKPEEPQIVLEQVADLTASETTVEEKTQVVLETNKAEIATKDVVQPEIPVQEIMEVNIPITYEELEANGVIDNPSEPISITILDEILEEENIQTSQSNSSKKDKKIKKNSIELVDDSNEINSFISLENSNKSTQDLIEEIANVNDEVIEITEIDEAVTQTESVQQEPDLFNFTDDLFSGLDDTYSSAAKNNNSIQSTFENLIGQTYKEPEFVKADDSKSPVEETVVENTKVSEEKPKKVKKEKKAKDVVETSIIDDAFATIKPKKGAKSVSEMFNKSITLGLNDRIAFQMHLFNDSDQDLNRVVSQLNTMNNITEALDFINHMVKPDYNNWEGKEEFENRFMALVEKRFS